MTVKKGRFGRFIACTEYPDCKTTMPYTIGVDCPKCKKGEVAEKRSRKGRTFYGCSRYPDCDFVSWYKPLNEPCPQCGADYIVEKYSKKTGAYIACLDKGCGYQRSAEEAAEAAS
jgi:DNA topoisomerase-1